MKKLFLDTNVVIDLLSKREPFYKAAVLIFSMAFKKKVSLYISPMTYATASYLLRKQGQERMILLLHDLRQLSKVTVADERVIDQTLDSDFTDIEDGMQYYSALSKHIDIIITRNVKDFVPYSELPVLTPDEFLANISKGVES